MALQDLEFESWLGTPSDAQERFGPGASAATLHWSPPHDASAFIGLLRRRPASAALAQSELIPESPLLADAHLLMNSLDQPVVRFAAVAQRKACEFSRMSWVGSYRPLLKSRCFAMPRIDDVKTRQESVFSDPSADPRSNDMMPTPFTGPRQRHQAPDADFIPEPRTLADAHRRMNDLDRRAARLPATTHREAPGILTIGAGLHGVPRAVRGAGDAST